MSDQQSQTDESHGPQSPPSTSNATPAPHDLDVSEEPISRPAYGKEQVKRVYQLIGINNRAGRKPIHQLVNDVWKKKPEWATAEDSWSEINENDRKAAEQELLEKLEEKYPLPGDTITARRIRQCRDWLPGFLLGVKHRARAKLSRDARSDEP